MLLIYEEKALPPWSGTIVELLKRMMEAGDYLQNAVENLIKRGLKPTYTDVFAPKCSVLGYQKEEGWRKGTIVKQYYREPQWPMDRWMPYQVRLDGEDVEENYLFAPVDADVCIRAAAE